MRLIDADKLIAQLKRYTWNMDADDAGYAMAIHDLLQDIDSQDTVQPTVNPWISVKERLPEDRHSVLVYCPYNKCIYTAYYDDFNDEWYYFGCGGGIEVYYTVTHWMPLPEQPEEGGGE